MDGRITQFAQFVDSFDENLSDLQATVSPTEWRLLADGLEGVRSDLLLAADEPSLGDVVRRMEQIVVHVPRLAELLGLTRASGRRRVKDRQLAIGSPSQPDPRSQAPMTRFKDKPVRFLEVVQAQVKKAESHESK